MNKPLPPLLVLALAAAMVTASFATPTLGSAPVLRVGGVVVAAAGLWLTMAGSRLFGRVGTNIKTFDDPDRLVVSGPFSRSRNPMYLGFLLFLTGLAAVLASPAAVFGPLVFFLAADRWYIPFEEARMAAVFGADYDRYRSEVRRWSGRRSRPAPTAQRPMPPCTS